MDISKAALSFSPETICSNHYFLVVCRIRLLATHIPSRTPRLLLVVRNPTLHPLQVPSATLLLHCFQHHQPIPPLPLPCVLLEWELPRHIVLANHLKSQLEATSWCCTQITHLPLCPRDPTQPQSFKKGMGTSWSTTSAPLGSISHTRKQDQLPNLLRYVQVFWDSLLTRLTCKNTLKYSQL